MEQSVQAIPGPVKGALVLPGQPAGLAGDAPTIPLKAIRDGIDDYDYVDLLKKQGDGAFADQVVHSVGSNFKDWSRDPDAVEKAHELLGDEIEKEGSARGVGKKSTSRVQKGRDWDAGFETCQGDRLCETCNA